MMDHEQKARNIAIEHLWDCDNTDLIASIAAALKEAAEAETRECVRIVGLARGFTDIGERDLLLIGLIEDALDARIPNRGRGPWISYPGDDGSEAPEIRARKAKAYADEVTRRCEAAAVRIVSERDRANRSWRNLWGWL